MLIKHTLLVFCYSFEIRKVTADVKSIYMLKSPLIGSITYRRLCNRFGLTPNLQTKIKNLHPDPLNDKGILVYHTELKNGSLIEHRYTGIEACHFSSTERKALGSSTKVSLTGKNVIEYCAPIYQLKIQSRNEMEIEVKRCDLRHTMQTSILIFRHLELFSQRHLQRTKDLVRRIIEDFSERGPLYKNLKSGEYFLLYFNNDMEGLVSFFTEYANIVNGLNIVEKIQELIMRFIYSADYLKYRSFFDEERFQSAAIKFEFLKAILIIDVLNVLSLANDENCIFTFPKIDHVLEFTKGVPALVVKIENTALKGTLKVTNDKYYTIKHLSESKENELVVVIFLYDLISADSNFLNISFKGEKGVYECESIKIRTFYEDFDK